MSKAISVFSDADSFELVQRQAQMLSVSELAPEAFRGKVANCVLALEIAQRLGMSAMSVMQELYIVHGKPSFSSKFIIATVNACGRFEPLEFELTGQGKDRSCRAHTRSHANPDRELYGPCVSIAMAQAEGWGSKSGSKWKTMPELMLHYRAATFFGRIYAPELMLGMSTHEEMHDAGPAQPVNVNPFIEMQCEAPTPEPEQLTASTVPDKEPAEREPGED